MFGGYKKYEKAIPQDSIDRENKANKMKASETYLKQKKLEQLIERVEAFTTFAQGGENDPTDEANLRRWRLSSATNPQSRILFQNANTPWFKKSVKKKIKLTEANYKRIANCIALDVAKTINSLESDSINEKFVADFVRWIQGEGVDPQVLENTWWWWDKPRDECVNKLNSIQTNGFAAKQLKTWRDLAKQDGFLKEKEKRRLVGKEFEIYLEEFVNKKLEFQKKMTMLKNFIPKDVNEAWLYWKYVIWQMAPLESDFMNMYVDTEAPFDDSKNRWPELRPTPAGEVPQPAVQIKIEPTDEEGEDPQGDVEKYGDQEQVMQQEAADNKSKGRSKEKEDPIQVQMGEFREFIENGKGTQNAELEQSYEELLRIHNKPNRTPYTIKDLQKFDTMRFNQWGDDDGLHVQKKFLLRHRDLIEREVLENQLREVEGDSEGYDEKVAKALQDELKEKKRETKKRVLGIYKEMGKISEDNIIESRFRPMEEKGIFSENARALRELVREGKKTKEHTRATQEEKDFLNEETEKPIDWDSEKTTRIKRKIFEEEELLIEPVPYNRLIEKLENAHEKSQVKEERERLKKGIGYLHDRVEIKLDASSSKEQLKERIAQSQYVLDNLDLFGDHAEDVRVLATVSLTAAERSLYDAELNDIWDELVPNSPPPSPPTPPKPVQRRITTTPVATNSVIRETLRDLPPDPLRDDYDPSSIPEPKPQKGDLIVKGFKKKQTPEKEIYGTKQYSKFQPRFLSNPHKRGTLEFNLINNRNELLEIKHDELEEILKNSIPNDAMKRRANILHTELLLLPRSVPYPDMYEKEEKGIKEPENFNSREELQNMDRVMERNKKAKRLPSIPESEKREVDEWTKMLQTFAHPKKNKFQKKSK